MSEQEQNSQKEKEILPDIDRLHVAERLNCLLFKFALSIIYYSYAD